jgi:hypothetical protein
MGTSSKLCPDCGLINPVSAEVCDCGYKFASADEDPYQVKQTLERKAKNLIMIGIISMSIGLGWWVVSFLLAFKTGGFYIVPTGAIMFGLASLVKGIGDKMRFKKIDI